MVRTRVGYCGGTLPDPTYHHLGDHTETVQVDFDPTRITYARLLDLYFTGHACGGGWSRQYRSAIFYADAGQQREARAAAARHGQAASVDIEPLRRFYLAEDYHQKYYLRQTPLAAEYARIYPREADFVNSTAVARANAYVGGGGRRETLEADLPRLGLSAEGQSLLRRSLR